MTNRRRPTRPKSFAARYPGICSETGRPFAAGARIERAPGGGWRLAALPPGAVAAAPKPASQWAPGFDAWQRARIEADEDAREHRKASFIGADEPVPDYVLEGRDRDDRDDGDAFGRVEAEQERAAYAAEMAAEDLREPPIGSWASVARMMADGDDSGFDWDAWKDEMKETDGRGYGYDEPGQVQADEP